MRFSPKALSVSDSEELLLDWPFHYQDREDKNISIHTVRIPGNEKKITGF